MNIEIDENSGYCFGVEFAIKMAEEEMEDSGKLYCLGDIVHNDLEVQRLNKKGLQVCTVSHVMDLPDSSHACTVWETNSAYHKRPIDPLYPDWAAVAWFQT